MTPQERKKANLKKGTNLKDRSAEEVRKIARKGGINSGKARRDKKNLRLALEALLESDLQRNDGVILSGAEAISAEIFKKALDGDIRAFETIRSTVGQDPVQKVEQTNIDMEYKDSVDYVEKLMDEEK